MGIAPSAKLRMSGKRKGLGELMIWLRQVYSKVTTNSVSGFIYNMIRLPANDTVLA